MSPVQPLSRGERLTLLDCIVTTPNAANIVPLTTDCMSDAQLGDLIWNLIWLLSPEDRRHVLAVARSFKAEEAA